MSFVNHAFKAFMVISSTLILGSLFTGCIHDEDQRTAGVDDFPNSIQARVNDFLAESKKSSEITTAATVTSTLPSQGGFNLAAPKQSAVQQPLAKMSASNQMPSKISATDSVCTSTLNYDTALISATETTVNKVTFCADSKLFDNIKGNETILSGSVTTTYSNGSVDKTVLTDADGDGILNPVPGRRTKSSIVITKNHQNISEKTTMVVGPGKDDNFDTEPDNLIYYLAWIKTDTILKDTVARAQYFLVNPTVDSILIDNSAPSLVDVDLYQKGPNKDHADGLWSLLKARLLVRYKEEPKETKRLHSETLTQTGHYFVADILNLKKEPDLNFSDTLLVRFSEVSRNPNDTLDSLTSLLKMKLGKNLEIKTDDSVYTVHSVVEKKRGVEKTATFDFQSELAIPSGQKPSKGTLSMKIEYTDFSTLEVNGKLSKEGLDVTIKNRDGKKQHVIWDAAGRGVLLEDAL